MFLIDTSVWIGYLRDDYAMPVRWFREILDHGYPFGLTAAIYQEILQGADSEKSFERLDEYLSTQVFYEPLDPLESYREAARLFFRCRREGITVRSTLDCLIAQVAIEHGLILVHHDRDFDFMATVAPELRLYTGSFGDPAQSSVIHEPTTVEEPEMTTIHARLLEDFALVPHDELRRLVKLARTADEIDLQVDDDDVPTSVLMGLAERGGAFDFWHEDGEDVYTAEDGQAI